MEQRILSHSETTFPCEVSYGRLLEAVIAAPGDSPLLDKLFVVEGGTISMFAESLSVLSESIKKESFPSSKLDRTVRLLKGLISSDAVVSAIVDICLSASNRSESYRVVALKSWEETTQILISLPSRIANKFERLTPEFFAEGIYSKFIFSHLSKAIGILYNVNSILYEIDNTSVSIMLSKCINNFSSENSADIFVQIMSHWCKERPNFSSWISDILLKIEQKSTERTAALILRSSSVNISGMLGNCILQSSWRYSLCKKIPFLVFHSDDNIIINLVKYLGNLSDKSILSSVLSDLLRVWSDKSSINHVSYEQHLYITKIILLSVTILSEYIIGEKELKSDLNVSLLQGVSAHLESTVEHVRIIGMFTAEHCMSLVGHDSEQKLEFDYTGIKPEQANIVQELKSFSTYDFKMDVESTDYTGDELLETMIKDIYLENESPQLKCLVRSPALSDLNKECTEGKRENPEENNEEEDTKEVKEEDQEILDSDDEFEPYDTSNDVESATLKSPKYLRDLIDLLNEEQDLDLWEECIKVAEDLVIGQLPHDDVSLAIGLLDILLSLENKFSVSDFETYRFNACVAILMIKPESSAEHLGREFNTFQKYSITVKNLMLDILTTAAQKLSKPRKEKFIAQTVRDKILGQVKRTSGKVVIKKGSENSFSCAGSFIFPLIRGQSFKTLQETPLLLAAALRAVAIITSCSQNLGQVTVRICREVLELAWIMRYHSEITVRSGAVACVASVLLAAPGVYSQLDDELMEAREWLSDIVHLETDKSLKGFAAHVLLLLDKPQGFNELHNER